MSRYTGPKNRVARRFGVNLFGRARNPLAHKPNPPGMHGAKRKKKSDFGIQLEEKQKLKAAFGMLSEKQLMNYYKKAARFHKNTAEIFLQMLDMRLDNVVFRLKFGLTPLQAQQLVSHGHVLVNGRMVNISSYSVKAGDEVSVKDKPKTRQLALRNLELTQIVPVPDWLTVDRDALKGKVARIPSREEIQPMVNEQLIVELYSR